MRHLYTLLRNQRTSKHREAQSVTQKENGGKAMSMLDEKAADLVLVTVLSLIVEGKRYK
jgi:hypothetical protein